MYCVERREGCVSFIVLLVCAQKMVTALVFGKPLPRTTSASSAAKEKEKEDDKNKKNESWENGSERDTTTAAAPATARGKPSSSDSMINNDCQKLSAHSQRRKNDGDGGFAATAATATTTQTQSKILPANTNIRSTLKIQNGDIVPLMPNKSAPMRPLKHDEVKGSINSKGEKFPKNQISAHPAAAAVSTTNAVVPTRNTLPGEEERIKTFDGMKEYQYQHGRLPTDSGKSNFDFADLQSYLEGKKRFNARIDLLRSIGMLDKAAIKVGSKNMCMFKGCKRELGDNEALHCAEHSNGRYGNVYTPTPNPLALGDHSTSIDTYNTSKPAAKKAKVDSDGMSSKSFSISSPNGTKYTLKSPPEETVKYGGNPEETSNIEAEDEAKMVKLVADAVAKELRYLSLQSPTDHIESSVKKFAIEVYYPLLSSSKERERSTSSSYSASRVLLSTLLALQEMLIINADRFFPLAGLKDSSAEKESDEKANSKLARDFARAVIQNAAKRLQRMTSDVIPNQDCLFDQYLETSRRYESKGEDFQLALERLDASATYRNAKGSTLGERESIMARTSFNFAREQHPLIREDDQPSAHPFPNACAVFVMGKSKSEKKKEITTQMGLNIETRHHKRTQARESRIRSLKYYNGL
jgi:hypothetical protein